MDEQEDMYVMADPPTTTNITPIAPPDSYFKSSCCHGVGQRLTTEITESIVFWQGV